MEESSKGESTCGESLKVSDSRSSLPGRKYVAKSCLITVDNEDHCDFRKLRSLMLRVHMLDLVTTTEETHYEAYRQTQMETRKFGEPKVKKLDNPKFKEEEELLRKRFTEQVKLEESRFRQWEQHVSASLADQRNVMRLKSLSPTAQLIAERDRLNKDLEHAHSAIKQLEVGASSCSSKLQQSADRHSPI
jgi:cell division control protein 12